jgi:hypothetical protein
MSQSIKIQLITKSGIRPPRLKGIVKLLYLDDLCDSFLELIDEEIDLAAVVVHPGQLVHQSLLKTVLIYVA